MNMFWHQRDGCHRPRMIPRNRNKSFDGGLGEDILLRATKKMVFPANSVIDRKMLRDVVHHSSS